MTLFRQGTVLIRLVCLFLLFCQVLQYRFLVLLANTLIAIMPLSSSPKICYLHLLRGILAQPLSIDRQLLAGKQGHKIGQVAPVHNQVYPPVHWKAHHAGKIVHWKAHQSHIAFVHNQTSPSLISSRCSSCRATPSFRAASTTRWHFLMITQPRFSGCMGVTQLMQQTVGNQNSTSLNIVQ